MLFKSAAAAAAKSLQSCPTLCDPIDCSPPGSPVPGILQARILKWVAISSSNAWKWKVKVKSLSCVPTLSDPMDYSSPGLSIHGIFQARVLEWGAIAFSYSSLLLSISLFFFFIFSLFRCSNVGCIYFLQQLYILFLYNFIYLFLAVLGLYCYTSFSLVVMSMGYTSLQCWGSHCSGFSCFRSWILGHAGFSHCGTQVQ